MREYFIDGIPYISKEQFCKLAHIRKANALKLIQSGLIPYIDIGNQTHRYLIRQSDAEAYLTDRAHDPAKYSFQRKSRIQTYPGKFDRNFANELSQYASVLSNYARLHGGRLPVLTNFCLEEYLNIGYMEGISDVFNSIRGFNMSVQVAVQSLSQWKEKYPGMEWENQLGSFDMTLYMGCNDMTSAEYFAKKCGKVTISVTNNQFPLAPLFSPIYSTTRPYSQTRSNTQRDLLQPDEFLRLDKFKCIVMFNHYKPAELYKIMLEELPAYKELVKCSVFDYVPEWKRLEDENKKRTPQKTASVPHETSEGHSPQAAAHFVQQENTSEKKQVPDREKACTRKPHAVAMPRQKSGEQCIYDFSDMKEGTSPEDIGLVEMTRSAVIGEDEPDLEELDDPSRIPPGCGI